MFDYHNRRYRRHELALWAALHLTKWIRIPSLDASGTNLEEK